MEERFETFTVLINRVARNVRRIKNEEMAEYGLRSAHVSCLYHLYREDGMTATVLCERCEEDKATVSRALDFLEREGYLTCESKRAKRYKSPLVLTEKGRVVGCAVVEKIDRVLQTVGMVLSEEDRLAFYGSLTKISDALDKIGGEV